MNSRSKITVGVSVIPPMVVESGSGFSGFEIELWERIASDLKLDFSYKKYDFEDLLAAAKKKNVDVAIAGITETEKREILIDFSHKTLDSSLSILISKKQASSVKTIYDFIIENYKKILLSAISIAAIIALISNIVWLLEKQSDVLNNPYRHGVFESVYTIISAMTNSGFSSELVMKTFWGKSMILFAMIFGLFMFGCFTAGLASFLTAAKIKYRIESPKDLAGKKVATKEHTMAVEELEKLDADVITVKEIEKAYDMLKKYKVDAVVFDTPTLLNYIKSSKDNSLAITGKFSRQTYGFVFPNNSKLKEAINREILRLHDIGEYDLLYKKWFG
ncbi:MAG: transporter substrate-binding domain-containing protein [Candidatus Pacebacteria bacterium]|nr:transporter substrate-binding domain-containing protein [Candidatus Paceibacterota bacterium]